MSDDYVDAARCAHAAASYNLNEFPQMTHEEEVAVWKQAFLEQKARADSNFRAWLVMAIAFAVSNLFWLDWAWRSR